jgi:hypothetical protein
MIPSQERHHEGRAMEGYEVLTTDDDKVGHVVGRRDGFLIVETGHLLTKHRHALPEQFAHVEEGENVVRINVSRELVHDSPKLSDDDFDALAVSRYYGLVDETTGEPGLSAEENERLGIESSDQRRPEIQTHHEGSSGTEALLNPSRAASQRLERP